MATQSSTNEDSAARLKVTAAGSTEGKPVRKPFPGPRGAAAALRVAVDREAHAEIVAHAKGSLRAEVCGVLVGEIGRDDEGIFAHVQAVIRGAAASSGSTHVTFTQETWTLIHAALERDHPKKKMIGWYHTHPGFGVEFSEMDLFIQKNFFSGPSQIALVTDPVSGEVAIAVNEAQGIIYLPRYWVDGREQAASVPAALQPAAGVSAGTSGMETRSIEERLGQLASAVEDLRHSLHRFLLTAGGIVGLGVVAVVACYVRDQFRERVKPPEIGSYAPVPVKIGDKTVMLGLGVVKWEVPDELNALIVEMARLKSEEEAAKAKKDTAPAKAP